MMKALLITLLLFVMSGCAQKSVRVTAVMDDTDPAVAGVVGLNDLKIKMPNLYFLEAINFDSRCFTDAKSSNGTQGKTVFLYGGKKNAKSCNQNKKRRLSTYLMVILPTIFVDKEYSKMGWDNRAKRWAKELTNKKLTNSVKQRGVFLNQKRSRKMTIGKIQVLKKATMINHSLQYIIRYTFGEIPQILHANMLLVNGKVITFAVNGIYKGQESIKTITTISEKFHKKLMALNP